MKKYMIRFTEEAENDCDELFKYISGVASWETAIQYDKGIYETIAGLSYYGGVLPVSQMSGLRKKYGEQVRTVQYRKMTIVYNVMGPVVWVRRVIAGNLIR